MVVPRKKVIVIPKTVTKLGSELGRNTECIEVDSNNPKYCSVDGVVYTKNQQELVSYPAYKAAVAFAIPESVTKISLGALENNQYIETIYIPDSIESMEVPYLHHMLGLKNVTVSDTNTKFSCADGVLYDKNKTTLLQYPRGKAETTYVVPSTVTTIGECAFYGCTNIQEVTMPEGLTTILGYGFSNSSIQKLELPSTVIDMKESVFYGANQLTAVLLLKQINSKYSLFNDLKTTVYFERGSSLVGLHLGQNAVTIVPEGTKQIPKNKAITQKISGFTVTEKTKTSVTLQWGSMDGIQDYILLNGTEIIATIPAKDNTYKLEEINGKPIKAGTVLNLNIVAHKIDGDYELYSDGVDTSLAVVTEFEKLPSVSNFKVKKQTNNTLTLSWNDVGEEYHTRGTAYELFQYNSKTKEYESIAVIGTDRTSYKIKNLKEGQTYKFKFTFFKAYLVGQESIKNVSEPVSIKTATTTKSPTISSACKAKSKITVKWKKNNKADGYEVYISKKKGSAYQKAATITNCSKTKTTIKALSNQKNYIKMRTYVTVDGKKIYSKYSTIKVAK